MKRLISFVLSLILLISSFGAFGVSAKVKVKYGDVDSNGYINNKDAGLLMQYVSSWDVSNFMISAADVNRDNCINNKDVALLLRYINGWEVSIGARKGNIAGKTIRFFTTINPASDETGVVVEKFEEDYGVTVEIVLGSFDEYAQQCQGLIAAGDAPDVARSNGDFPAFVGYLQSLDAAKLDYDDPIWDQNMFEISTFGGSPYLCNTVGNIMAEADMVVYSKSMLKRANANTPEEYDAMGKWTWDAFFEIGNAVQKITGTPGAAINSNDTYFNACGGSAYKLENGKFVNGINNKSVQIMQRYAQAIKDHTIASGISVANGITSGQIGIRTAHAWSLRKSGDLNSAGGDWNDLGFYYLPYYDLEHAASATRTMTGILRGWGICKGAQEPVAAGVFLREYLDISNYDISNIFINSNAKTFFFNLTNKDNCVYNPYFTYLDLNSMITNVKAYQEIYSPMYCDPSQVPTAIASVKSAVDKGVNNLNAYIEQYVNAY